MKMRGLGIICILVGITLLITSWFWTSLVNSRRNWSDQQAKEYADTLADVHRLGGELAAMQQSAQTNAGQANSQAALANTRLADSAAKGKPIDPATATADRVPSQLRAAKARNQQLRSALDTARTGDQDTATIMRWLGIGLTGLGAIGLLSARSGRAD